MTDVRGCGSPASARNGTMATGNWLAPVPIQDFAATGGDDGQMVGMLYGMLAATALVAGPALGAALLWSWWGLPVGLVTGWLAWWGFGRLAGRRLEVRGPELLSLLRTHDIKRRR